MAHLIRFVTEERGATAIEYGMLCSLCVITILAALNEFATDTVDLWTQVATHV